MNRRVRRVALQVGVHAGVAVEAIAFRFDLIARGGLCEGARLEIEQIDGRARCRACDSVFALPSLTTRCSCGASDYDMQTGNDLRVHQIETESA